VGSFSWSCADGEQLACKSNSWEAQDDCACVDIDDIDDNDISSGLRAGPALSAMIAFALAWLWA
jgi:hypothetical protein